MSQENDKTPEKSKSPWEIAKALNPAATMSSTSLFRKASKLQDSEDKALERDDSSFRNCNLIPQTSSGASANNGDKEEKVKPDAKETKTDSQPKIKPTFGSKFVKRLSKPYSMCEKPVGFLNPTKNKTAMSKNMDKGDEKKKVETPMNPDKKGKSLSPESKNTAFDNLLEGRICLTQEVNNKDKDLPKTSTGLEDKTQEVESKDEGSTEIAEQDEMIMMDLPEDETQEVESIDEGSTETAEQDEMIMMDLPEDKTQEVESKDEGSTETAEQDEMIMMDQPEDKTQEVESKGEGSTETTEQDEKIMMTQDTELENLPEDKTQEVESKDESSTDTAEQDEKILGTVNDPTLLEDISNCSIVSETDMEISHNDSEKKVEDRTQRSKKVGKALKGCIQKRTREQEGEFKKRKKRKLENRMDLAKQPKSQNRVARTLRFKGEIQEILKDDVDEMWLQCNACNKWRRLNKFTDPSTLPRNWYCSMNEDGQYDNCLVEEEEWKYDDEDYIYANYTVGSVVWAQVPTTPWWPAMIDVDPEFKVAFWIESGNPKPTYYHVTFFGEPVTRAWVLPGQMKCFKKKETAQLFSSSVVERNLQLRRAVHEARHANKMDVKKRRLKYTFVERYTGSPKNSPKYGKALTEEMCVSEPELEEPRSVEKSMEEDGTMEFEKIKQGTEIKVEEQEERENVDDIEECLSEPNLEEPRSVEKSMEEDGPMELEKIKQGTEIKVEEQEERGNVDDIEEPEQDHYEPKGEEGLQGKLNDSEHGVPDTEEFGIRDPDWLFIPVSPLINMPSADDVIPSSQPKEVVDTSQEIPLLYTQL